MFRKYGGSVAGGYHAVALKSDGTVVAWGYNGYGHATVLGGLSGVVVIAAGESHTVALKSDGSVVAWGNNSNGQTTVPSGLNRVAAIAAGAYHTVALVPLKPYVQPAVVSADPDNDGIPNLIEWACNLNPTISSTLPITIVGNGGAFEFTYARSVAAVNAGASFTVEWIDTLQGPDPWSTTGVTEYILSDNGTVQQVKATLPVGNAGHRYVHLKVTSPQ